MVRTYSDFEESWALGGPLLGSLESRQGSHVESTQTQGAKAVTDKIHWPIKWRLEVLSFCSSKMVKNGRMETLPLNPTLGLKLERLDLVDFHLHLLLCQQVKKVSLSDTPSLSPISSQAQLDPSTAMPRKAAWQQCLWVALITGKGNRQVAEAPKFWSVQLHQLLNLKKKMTYKKSFQYHIPLRFFSPPSTPKKRTALCYNVCDFWLFIQTSIKMNKNTHHPQHHH